MLNEISKKLYTRYYNSGDIIFQEGELPDCIHFILNGEAGLFLDGQQVLKIGSKNCIGKVDNKSEY